MLKYYVTIIKLHSFINGEERKDANCVGGQVSGDRRELSFKRWRFWRAAEGQEDCVTVFLVDQ